MLNNKKEKIKTTTASLLAVAQLCLLAGCNNCEEKDKHAHVYDSNSTYRRYIESEKRKYDSRWFKTDEYIIIDKEDEKLLEFERDNNLFLIDLNVDKIDEVTTTHSDHLEYKYLYTKPGIIVGPIILPEDGYSWTPYEDYYQSLTGETREAHFMYYGYKVYKNKEGEYVKEKSDLVDNLYDLPEEYAYITPVFYTLVDPETKQELDYGTKNIEDILMYEDYSYSFYNNHKNSNKNKTKSLTKSFNSRSE